MATTHKNSLLRGLIMLFLATLTLSETIQLSSNMPINLFSNLQSTWNTGSLQKQQLNNIFSTDSFFGPAAKTKQTGVGNNILQGSNNQMQGTNNKMSGNNNTLIGLNSTIVGDLNKAFGISNTIIGSKNEIIKGNNNQIKGN